MTLRGTYPGLERGRLLMMALALAYVVSPVDVMPEALMLLAGLGDDAFVLAWLAGAVLVETEPSSRGRAAGRRVRPGRRSSRPGALSRPK